MVYSVPLRAFLRTAPSVPLPFSFNYPMPLNAKRVVNGSTAPIDQPVIAARPTLFARSVVYLGLVLIAFIGAPVAHAEGPKWDPVTPAELAETKPQIEPEAAAEILSYRLEIDRDIFNWSSVRRAQFPRRYITKHIRFKIYDPSRATDATRLTQVTDDSAGKYYDMAARLTLPDGTTRTFGKSDLRTKKIVEEGRGNGFLGLLESKSTWAVQENFLAVNGVVKGAVLDIWEHYSDEIDQNWLMNSIQRAEIPIRRFDYTSHYSARPDELHRIYVLNPCGGKLTQDDKLHLDHVTAENLPSITTEPWSAPESYFSLTIIEAYEPLTTDLDQRHKLKVSLPKAVPFSLGPWAYFATERDFYDADWGYITKRIKEKGAELVAGATSERDKARRIYNFVQAMRQRVLKRADLENEFTRYIESVDELTDLDRVDSTIIRVYDFHYLFIALIRSVGLECHSTHHPERDAFRFTPDLVSSRFVDHWAIAVKIDGAWVICDPVAEEPVGFSQLSWELENQPALLAMPQQQVFLFIPAAPAEKSVVETKAELELDPAGNLQGECIRSFTGHEAQQVRQRLHEIGEEKWGKEVRSLFNLEGSLGDAHLLSVEGLASLEEAVRVKAFIRWPSYAAMMEKQMMISPSVFSAGRPPLLNENSRKTPVFFRFPRTERDSITIRLPPGYAPAASIKPITASTDDFSYALSITYAADNRVLSIARESINRAVEIPVEHYAQARDWFRRITSADQIGLVLSAHELPK